MYSYCLWTRNAVFPNTYEPLFSLKLHLGVNSGSVKFAIEQQAVNEATFRCPDELGWQPQVDMHHLVLHLFSLSLNCH